MSAFTRAFTVFFASLSSWLSAIEKTGKAVDNLATVAEEASGQYADEARAAREIKGLEFKARLAEQRAKLALPVIEASAS